MDTSNQISVVPFDFIEKLVILQDWTIYVSVNFYVFHCVLVSEFTIKRPPLKYRIFSQRIVDESSTSSSSAAISSVPPTNNSSFNYLYEYSETRKVLEEFFKPDETQEKMQQPFRVSDLLDIIIMEFDFLAIS